MSASVSAQAALLRRHFTQIILPLWRGPGFNQSLQLPYEAVDAVTQAPLPATRYRAMACARQLFVFSQAGDAVHAHTLFAAMCDHFRDPRHDGWLYSIDAQGAPLDPTKDLYTHAFILFACAAYFTAFGQSAARDVAAITAMLISERFTPQPGDFLCDAARSADFSTTAAAPLQNPLMHLLEAWLAASDAFQDAAYDDALLRTAQAVEHTFVEPATGCIAELPLGSAGNRIEPGHQFEWCYLVAAAGGRLATSGLARALTRANRFAELHGIEPRTGGVHAVLDLRGACLDPTQRIWAQTEYLRAQAIRPDSTPATQDALAQYIVRFRERFLHPLGWHECKTPADAVARTDMPSTTPYHLASAYAALPPDE